MPAPTAVRPPTAELAAAFAAIYIVWGSTFLAIRYAVETIPPFAMVAARCLLGGAVLVGIALVRERSGLSWPTWREWGGSVVLGAALPLLSAGVILMLVSLGSGELSSGRLDHVSARSAGGLAYLIVFGTVVTFSAYVWLLRVVSPSRVATYAFVNPAVAVILGWGLAGESLSVGAVLASVVILVAVAVAVSERDRAPVAPARFDSDRIAIYHDFTQ
jgi:drug/metabolite transporter (DMT)-like permease